MRGHQEAQIVALYLMTCPTSDMTGVFHCPLMYIAHETGLGLEGASKGLQSLIEGDFCTFDEETDIVFVHEMAKYQIAEELKVSDNQAKGVKKAYLSMPAAIRVVFYARYKEAFHLGDESPLEAPTKPRTRARTETGERTGAGTDSDPNGSGGQPPAQLPEKSLEEKTKQEIWRSGKSLLSQAGMPEAQCGSFIGKLVGDYGTEIVLDAVRTAVVEQTPDPASYLKAVCQRRKGERKTSAPWWSTDELIIAKGVELGLSPLAGESMAMFKGRIQARIDNDGKPVVPKVLSVVTATRPEPDTVPVSPENRAAALGAARALRPTLAE
jgi:hypothetical protein